MVFWLKVKLINMERKDWAYILLLLSVTVFFTYFFFITVALSQITVVDADTIILNKEKIRLYGIDAPETEQNCYVNKEAWPCGKQATEYLKKLLEEAPIPSLLCEISSQDRYGRSIGVCYIGDKNINRDLVENGWALAYREYSRDYIQNEKLASKRKIGVWQGDFVEPWKWRRGVRTKEAKKIGCQIKGNISSSGEKIYHLPNSKNYLETKISSSKGERWFCSEKEAQAHGWRKPKIKN